jgi:chromosome segregation ATPase
MSSPKEVAAEAFSLLNSALEESEARVEELTKELWRKRPTKNNLEKQLDVIKHRQLMTDALQREVAELRAQLAARTDTTEESAGSHEDRDNELNATLQQSEARIQELTEAANSWKRKYEFLSTSAPAAYQTQEAAEK